MEDLDISDYQNVNAVPAELVNLKLLICSNTRVRIISAKLVNLVYLNCSNTEIIDIPVELVSLKELNYDNCYWLKQSDINSNKEVWNKKN